jgi:hypothetical protein
MEMSCSSSGLGKDGTLMRWKVKIPLSQDESSRVDKDSM